VTPGRPADGGERPGVSDPPRAGRGAGLKFTIERERMLAVGPAFRLPALAGTPLSPRRLTAVYFDTRDHRLARAGITLRHYCEGHRREGTAGRWQLTLPRGDARLHLEAAGSPDRPLAALTRLVLAHTRGRPLGPVATLRTRRRAVRVRDAAGLLAEVALDDTAVLTGRRVARRVRELAIDTRRDDDEALAALEARLQRAGARAGDGRPTVVQALGLARPSPPPPVDPAASAREQLRAMLARQLVADVFDLPVRDGGDRDASVVGAALLARIATGHVIWEDAARAAIQTSGTVTSPRATARYRAKYTRFRQLADRLRDTADGDPAGTSRDG